MKKVSINNKGNRLNDDKNRYTSDKMGELRNYVQQMKSDQKRMHIRSNAFDVRKSSLSKNLIIIKGQT